MKIDKKPLLGAVIISGIVVCLYLIFSFLPVYNALANPENEMAGVMGSGADDPIAQYTLWIGIGSSIVVFCILTLVLYFLLGYLLKKKK